VNINCNHTQFSFAGVGTEPSYGVLLVLVVFTKVRLTTFLNSYFIHHMTFLLHCVAKLQKTVIMRTGTLTVAK
jgi:hypothetical protein